MCDARTGISISIGIIAPARHSDPKDVLQSFKSKLFATEETRGPLKLFAAGFTE